MADRRAELDQLIGHVIFDRTPAEKEWLVRHLRAELLQLGYSVVETEFYRRLLNRRERFFGET